MRPEFRELTIPVELRPRPWERTGYCSILFSMLVLAMVFRLCGVRHFTAAQNASSLLCGLRALEACPLSNLTQESEVWMVVVFACPVQLSAAVGLATAAYLIQAGSLALADI